MEISHYANVIWRKVKTLPMIMQDEIAECGHACIAMISHFWGYKITTHGLRNLYASSMKGITLREMMDLFTKLGFKTRALRIPLEELKWINCPAILHWNLNHFVVLKKIKKKSVIIHDPAFGVRHCSIKELSESFTGIVLDVEKPLEFKYEVIKNNLSFADIFRLFKGMNKWIIVLLFLSLSVEILSLINPLFIQYITDHVISTNNLDNLYAIVSGFVLLVLFYIFIEYIRNNMVLYLTSHLTEKFSSSVMLHLLKLPLNFFESRHKGDIQSKFQSIDEIQKKLSSDFVNTVLDGFMFIINLIFMLIYSSLLTAIVLVGLTIYFSLRYFSFQSLKKQTTQSIHQHAKVTSIFLETLQAILPIKSFVKENMRFQVWQNHYVDSLNTDIKISKLKNNYHVLNQLLLNLEHIIVICVGAQLVLNNQFSLGMLLAFLAYRLILVNKSSSFIQNIFDYKLTLIQLNRLSDIIYQKPEQEDSKSRTLIAMRGSLALHDVEFRYHVNEKNIFDNLNVEIQAGEHVVITGASGCGKSTLLKIMMGLLKPIQGQVGIDGILLEDFGLMNYRKSIASVMQDDVLLSGSILENIVFFEENISMQEVYNAAKIACIHEVIQQFPMKYETLVGDMGSTLSGGQKQRILLARALYKKPKILFLDEATCHLDDENERRINDALKNLKITQICIAHRQETIRSADRVIRL